MAYTWSIIQILFLIFFVSQLPCSTCRPASIYFDLERDQSTQQYMIKINQGTPQSTLRLVLDFGGKLPWIQCLKDYNSSSIRSIKCTSSICSLASKPVNTCIPKKACSIYTSNPVTQSVGEGELVSDLVAVRSNFKDEDGIPVGSPRRFTFGCATTANISGGISDDADGVAGLGRSSALSLVSQFTVGLRLPRIFALEFSGWFTHHIYFGGGPYINFEFSTKIDKNPRVLGYTPFLVNPKNKEDYFVDLKSIQIHGKTVPIDKKLLSINKETGTGGTKIDIQTPYTTLESSIYKAFVKVHTEWAHGQNISKAAAVAPFSTCYTAGTVPAWLDWGIRISPQTLVFVFPKIRWDIVKTDLIKVFIKNQSDYVVCLAFLDGGSNPSTSIVIGAHQMGFAEFDLSRSRFGFMQPQYIPEF
ncbi:basic 7S globulin-like [Papaver somniferum]|uniref:basic 7S globulin-like n=1 Tax=Papaver somniferum TaxID=3469 RepID=UPI000E70032F|nr:basic 7S globulin-like [Papaver somniferum]